MIERILTVAAWILKAVVVILFLAAIVSWGLDEQKKVSERRQYLKDHECQIVGYAGNEPLVTCKNHFPHDKVK